MNIEDLIPVHILTNELVILYKPGHNKQVNYTSLQTLELRKQQTGAGVKGVNQIGNLVSFPVLIVNPSYILVLDYSSDGNPNNAEITTSKKELSHQLTFSGGGVVGKDLKKDFRNGLMMGYGKWLNLKMFP